MKERPWKYFVIIITIIVLDQITKALVLNSFILGERLSIVPGLFNLTFVKNPGAAFGIFSNSPDFIRKPLMLLPPILVSVWLLYMLWTSFKENMLLTWAYTLIVAGALGNFIDRLIFGYVVDFLDFYFGRYHFPAFNVADSAISTAFFLLILYQILLIKHHKK